MTILAKIQYCSPVWSGYCSAADRARLDGFLKRCKRRGFCEKELPSVTQIFDDADNIFFAGILKTINKFCRHSYLIVLFYNINLGNAHIITS